MAFATIFNRGARRETSGIQYRLPNVWAGWVRFGSGDVPFAWAMAPLALDTGLCFREIWPLAAFDYTGGVAIEASKSILGRLNLPQGVARIAWCLEGLSRS